MVNDNILKCSPYSQLSAGCRIFNKEALADKICIQLPYVTEDWHIYSIADVRDNIEVDISKISQSSSWLDIPAKLLNLDIGQHIYKVSFASVQADVLNKLDMYFSYIIQSADFDKSYLYMSR